MLARQKYHEDDHQGDAPKFNERHFQEAKAPAAWRARTVQLSEVLPDAGKVPDVELARIQSMVTRPLHSLEWIDRLS